ncbi:hypothetical protein [Succinimonas amylolytica]|uniref:hypothetical protein n=1 Tax=Succinimonas amylolytica TaxID=83769 RepID=UPI00035E243D|nr:hypothetical protein [Succinimonas amylolytica]
MAFDNKELDDLLGKIAIENGVLIDKTDPVLVQVTIWNYLSGKLQEEIKNAHDTTIQNNIALFEDTINKNLMAASNDFENELDKIKETFVEEIKQEQQILRKDAEVTANSLVKSAVEYLNQYSLIQIRKDLKSEIKFKNNSTLLYILLVLEMFQFAIGILYIIMKG